MSARQARVNLLALLAPLLLGLANAPAVNALAKALPGGLARAAEAIDSGAAQALLARWSETSQRLAASR